MSDQTDSQKRYRLRESSKLPARYRDFVRDEFVEQNVTPYGPPKERRSQSSQQSSPSKQVPSASATNTTLSSLGKFEQPSVLDYPSDVEETSAEQDYNYALPEEHREPPSYRYNTERYGATGTDLSDDLKGNLRKLKNVLKLPKARRFVFCEFFYSGVDHQLFLAENEFSQLMKESFPNLKTQRLRKPEWREVRRLIGKPRRCSQVFLNEERESLEQKRKKIRTIYNGTCTSLGQGEIDLPPLLPRPPVVGMKVYARVRSPKDGIYAGTVDAIIDDTYRVVFDKDEMIPPSTIKDYEVMFDQPQELLSLNYFLEQNRANLRGTAHLSPMSHLYPAPNFITGEANKSKGMMVMGMQDGNVVPAYSLQSKKVTMVKDEKVGNFPVRMLVILVKLCKVIEYKKQLVNSLIWMNDNAEKMNLLSTGYPHEFKVQYSQLVLDIESINKLFKSYLTAIQNYHGTLLPHLNEPQASDRPDQLRKSANTHAFQIVKHCNNELNVKNKHVLQLITSLTSILIQVRTIGQQKKRSVSICDLNLLSESLKQIRSQIHPANTAAFQDFVEVHMKQFHKLMVKS